LSRNDWTNDLIESLQKGLITRQMLDARQRQKLMQQLTDEQRSALPMLNSATAGALASELRSKFAECDATHGDRERGQRVFQRVCATCHQLQGIGHSVGPSLANLSNRSADALLTAILDPNRAVEAAYLSYAMATTQGLRHSGIIANESSAAVTLLAPDAVRQTVLRNEIEEFVATGKSLMPEGLGSDLTPQEMSDLLAFLGTTTEQPKFFPGNEPQLAPTRNDGSIRLFAVHAQIYGPTLVFEAKNNNLGYWQSVEDRAVWRVHPHQAGRFDVRLDYACADDTAGNSYALIAGDQVLTGITQGTGSWDQFRGQSLGVVELPEGESTIMFRAAGPIAGFLFDLRTVYLYPAD
jgi:putative heme-binding domain-containing protein